MSRRLDYSLLARLLLPLGLALALQLQPGWRLLAADFHQVRQALANRAYASAAESLVRLAERLPERSDLWEQAGRAALLGADPALAIRAFQTADAAGNLTAAGWLWLGDAYEQTGDLPAALRAWQAALSAPPPAGAEPAALHLRLAAAYQTLSDLPAAIDALRQVVSQRPDLPEPAYRLGLLLAASQPELAPGYLQPAASLEPAYAATADELTRAITAATPSADPAYLLLVSGQTLARLDYWELASRAFEQAVRLNPEYAEAWAFLGQAHLQRGAEALPALQTALQLDPLSVAANSSLALYWRRQGQPEQALPYLQTALEQQPDNLLLHFDLGSLYAETGDLLTARQVLEAVAQRAPADPRPWQALVAFSLAYNVELETLALPAARQALAVASPVGAGRAAALDALAQVYLRLGDLPLAERLLVAALAHDRANPAVNLHLGLVYSLQGRGAQAAGYLNRVLALAPDSAQAEQALRLLENR